MRYLLDHNDVDRDYNTSHVKVSDCMCGVLNAFYKLTHLILTTALWSKYFDQFY